MKILAVKIAENFLFPSGIIFDFYAHDGVRKSYAMSEDTQPAFKIKTGFYSHVLMAMTGLNATGKTSALELLSLILSIVVQNRKLNDNNAIDILKKFQVKKERSLKFRVIFLVDNVVWRLSSEISLFNTSYTYLNEDLERLSLSKLNNKREIFDNEFKPYFSRQEILQKYSFVKGVDSIVSFVNGDANGIVYTNQLSVNLNVPSWSGHAPDKVVSFFDPSIKCLEINEGQDSNLEAKVIFENDQSYVTSVNALEKILSSGTIKGLSLAPVLRLVLKTGGYMILDEIENHLNRRIIKFIIDLFTNRRSNPNGACLIFSTHYPELLDFISRKDNVFITLRSQNNHRQVVRLDSYGIASRSDVLKSKMVINNLIKGTAPESKDLEEVFEYLVENMSANK